jgi:CRISPR/Cas system CMR subunit Cmr6 (Cas7 group RAMP superfamily)
LQQLTLAAVEETTKPLRLAFGTMGYAGKVIFFDAVPTDPAKLKLDLDVMTPPGLTEMGVGAKTVVGYGVWRV